MFSGIFNLIIDSTNRGSGLIVPLDTFLFYWTEPHFVQNYIAQKLVGAKTMTMMCGVDLCSCITSSHMQPSRFTNCSVVTCQYCYCISSLNRNSNLAFQVLYNSVIWSH